MKVVMGNLAPGNVRLTKYHREAIASKVLNYKFQNSTNTLKSLETEHRNLAQAVYEATHSKSDREKMDSLPKGWMYETDSIKARFGGTVGSLNFNGSLYSLHRSNYSLLKKMGYACPDAAQKRVPFDGHYGIANTFDHHHSLTERFNALTNRFSTLMEESLKAKTVLEATLRNASTSNTLIKAWPEIEPFVKQVVGHKSAAAPSVALVVSVAELNSTFGLPVPA